MDANKNTGHQNTGHQNTGNRNTGHQNTGNRNTGHQNTGHQNTGDWNTGNWNTGNRNTGDWNTGHQNTGHQNTGNRNTGDWNTGHQNTGFFCTLTPKATAFDSPTTFTHEELRDRLPYVELSVGVEWVPIDKMSDAEKAANPTHATVGGFIRPHNKTIQEVFPLWWARASKEDRQKFLDFPNFDAQKFYECTGVDVRKPARKTVKVKLANGEVVEIEGELVSAPAGKDEG